MSHFNNTSTGQYGDNMEHLHQHARTDDDLWKDDEYDSSISRSHPTTGLGSSGLHGVGSNIHSSSQNHGDRLLYVEKVVKEYDAQGNVINERVEHVPPGSFDDISSQGLHSAAGAPAGTSGFSGRRQPMVSDDYGRTGASKIGNEAQRNATGAARERTNAQGTKPSFGDKITGQGQKRMGEATSNPNQFYKGDATLGGYNPLK